MEWKSFFSYNVLATIENWNMYEFSSSHSFAQEIVDMGVSWMRSFIMMLAPMLHVNPMITAMQWSTSNRGKVIIFKIEARAILEGLRLAWEKEIRQLKIECDNALLMERIVASRAVDSKMLE
ncbi:hypothetical protein Gorai_006150 [Gossypium raimondii]|uniref:RNase H type-1 domain-containing protein n=1 Tax=Gossypium raimondii TaxID=29730 RepID=A0A7J8QFA1_GOSRA|nr:hypothetical protein [Gossypium raimondii]